MDPSIFLPQLFLFLVTARVFAELATRMKSPAVIGELLAGGLLGPSLLGRMEPGETIRLFRPIAADRLTVDYRVADRHAGAAALPLSLSTSSPPVAA